MKNLFFIISIFIILNILIGSTKNYNKTSYYNNISSSTELAYIEKYKSYAIIEMLKFKIPASIIMAQALIESSAGTSELAQNANNHFAIKCKKSWKGKFYYYDDDYEKECFRSYLSVEDSYTDHSLFLISGERYKFLFELSLKDYKSWSTGLQKAGYATDDEYASKLILKIETYKLYLLDKL